MEIVRKPVVAGAFYPASAEELKSSILNMLEKADSNYPVPKAIIAPHAGYIYSGQIAANAYACLTKAATKIRRVVLLGPSHRFPLRGIAVPKANIFATPLGQIKIDQKAIAKILLLPPIEALDEAHAEEHSLEVQLPFLQVLLKDFSLVPLVVGDANPEEIAEVLEHLWDGDETLIVVSSDLSHYHDYATAQKMDKEAVQAILDLQPQNLKNEQACGSFPIRGLLLTAKKKNLHATLIDLCNSGDTAGPKDQVVGYGAIHFG